MQDTVKIVFQALGVLRPVANSTTIVINGEQHVGSEYAQTGTSNVTLIVPYGSIVTVPGTSGYNNRFYPLYSNNSFGATTTAYTFHAVFDVLVSATQVTATAE